VSEEEEPVDVVLTAGELDPVVVALREFLHRAGALLVEAVVDRGPLAEAAFVSCGRNTPVEVAEGERLVHLPHAVPLDPPPEAAIPVPDVKQLPPIEVDPDAMTLTGPLGGVQYVAEGVEKLAGAIGGRTVVVAYLPTLGVDEPLGIAARPGEAPVLMLGEEQFLLPPTPPLP
jgi:hypothetical protein